MAHAHIVSDSDNHFIIDPISRQISNNSKKTILIKTDHNSEQFTFELPRYVEGHDMSLSNKVEVHFLNINSKTRQTNPGIYNVVDFDIDAEDNTKVLGTWLVSREATKYPGSLNFVIRFSCLDDDNVEYYSWNTAIYTGITISDTIENTETIVEDYVDIFRQWLDALELAAGSSDIYAITDDGTITNLCEKVDGLDSHVTELEAQITGFSNQVTDFSNRVAGVEQDVSEIKENLNDSTIVKKSELIDLIYPVGSIYISISSTNPSNFIGGTWEAWGQGKVPVGVDPLDTDFDAPGKEGGEKTHVLSDSEMPRHKHGGYVNSGRYAGTPYFKTEQGALADTAAAGSDMPALKPGLGSSYTGAYGQLETLSVGNSDAHNNLQPYITCYMWKRTS